MTQKDRVELDNGMQLRLLSAWEVLEVRREAAELMQTERERALCSNACLLARALEQGDRTPVFADGRAVLSGLTVEEIGTLAARWSEFHRAANPGVTVTDGELENVKKNFVLTRENGCAGGC